MREVVITRYGEPDVLEEHVRDTPDPGPGEVRIRVKACGVNFADVLARLGLYPDAPRAPLVPGYEVSGYVDAIGPGPARHEVNRHVVALTRFGGYADVVVVPADYVWAAPPSLSHNEAAAMPVSYLTAFIALYRMANVKAGETVLVHGAGGNVGIAAIQLSRLRRAAVIGTAAAAKHNALRSLGIDHVLDPRTTEVETEVARLTNGRGVDVVLDPIGGDHLLKSYRLLAPMGRLVACGMQDKAGGQHGVHGSAPLGGSHTPRFDPADLMRDNKAVVGLNLLHLWGERKLIAAAMEALLTDVSGGRLRPVVSKTFPLGRAADAHAFLQERANVGKVVLTV